jgi:hypothetical protein
MSAYDQALQDVAEETFETLAFMLVMPDDEPMEPDPAMTACCVEFSGPFGGTLYVRVSSAMLPALAANMLGMEFDSGVPSPEQQRDALRELLNVVCGNLLPAIAGTEPLFNVGAPELLDEPDLPATRHDREPAGRARMELDSGSAELVLFMDRDPAAGQAA